MSDLELLHRLNAQYIEAALAGDVSWYETHLADDFVCIESDGTLLDREAFLRKTAQGSELATYQIEDVDVRRYGSVALVRATGAWTRKDGTPGLSHYTDVYVQEDGGWRVVSAQITRPRGARAHAVHVHPHANPEATT